MNMKLLTRLRELRNAETSSYAPNAASMQDENASLHQHISAFSNTLLDVDYIGVGTITSSDIKRIHAEKII
jgi:hypothetical protein